MDVYSGCLKFSENPGWRNRCGEDSLADWGELLADQKCFTCGIIFTVCSKESVNTAYCDININWNWYQWVGAPVGSRTLDYLLQFGIEIKGEHIHDSLFLLFHLLKLKHSVVELFLSQLQHVYIFRCFYFSSQMLVCGFHFTVHLTPVTDIRRRLTNIFSLGHWQLMKLLV